MLLYLSAAFYTVDHHILLQRLERSYGITGLVRQWFQSYLVCPRHFVRNWFVSFVSSADSVWHTPGVGLGAEALEQHLYLHRCSQAPADYF